MKLMLSFSEKKEKVKKNVRGWSETEKEGRRGVSKAAIRSRVHVLSPQKLTNLCLKRFPRRD